MGLIDKYREIIKILSPTAKKTLSLQGTSSTNKLYESFFQTFGKSSTWSSTDTVQGAVSAWSHCAPISQILYKHSIAFCNGLMTVNDSGKNKLSLRNRIHENILNTPNSNQTEMQFRASLIIYIRLFGHCFVLKQKDNLLGTEQVIGLYLLPPHMLSIKWKTDINPFASIINNIEKMEFMTTSSSNLVIDLEDVYCFTDTTIGSSYLLPSNRIASQKYAISNIVKCYEAKGVLVDNRGALGIISNDSKDAMGQSLPIDNDDRDQLQSDYKKYGMLQNQYPLIITNATVKYQQIASSAKDLMLDEFIISDVKQLCNAFSFPFQLLAEGSETTFNNQEEGSLLLYQNSVIPDSINFMQQYNDCLEAEMHGIEYSMTFDHLDVFKINQKSQAETSKIETEYIVNQFTNNIITYKKAVELLGYDATNIQDSYFYEMPIEFQQTYKSNKQEVKV